MSTSTDIGTGRNSAPTQSYSNHEILADSVGGWFKGKDPTGDPIKLKSRLGCHSETLYTGRADASTRGTRGLRKRITEFARFGNGEDVGQWGGRYSSRFTTSCPLPICVGIHCGAFRRIST